MTFGSSLVFGSNRRARCPLTQISTGCLLVLPRNWPVATLLPLNCQKFVAVNPFSAAAFTFVTFAPLPENAPAVTVPETVGLDGKLAFPTMPLNWPADSGPSRLLAVFAKMAYGVGDKAC